MTDSRLIKGFLQHIILIHPELRCYVSCHISDLSGIHVLNLLCYLKQRKFQCIGKYVCTCCIKQFLLKNMNNKAEKLSAQLTNCISRNLGMLRRAEKVMTETQ